MECAPVYEERCRLRVANTVRLILFRAILDQRVPICLPRLRGIGVARWVEGVRSPINLREKAHYASVKECSRVK